MLFVLEFPMHNASNPCDTVSSMAEIARAAEEGRFGAIGFSDHPAPSVKWHRDVGHDSLDPFAAMAFCAAVTLRIRVMSYLTVAPYRNPLLLAKSIATVDVLSAGRSILGLGSGYLRSEFAALGVDFAARGTLLDETIEVLSNVWSDEAFAFRGREFHALEQVSRPAPVQRPHPPLWFGGNSELVLDRVARSGSGWAPLLMDGHESQSIRTRTLKNDELVGRVTALRKRLVQQGRADAHVDVLIKGRASDLAGRSNRHLEVLRSLVASGATAYSPALTGRTTDELIAMIERYGEDVIRVVNGQ